MDTKQRLDRILGTRLLIGLFWSHGDNLAPRVLSSSAPMATGPSKSGPWERGCCVVMPSGRSRGAGIYRTLFSKSKYTVPTYYLKLTAITGQKGIFLILLSWWNWWSNLGSRNHKLTRFRFAHILWIDSRCQDQARRRNHFYKTFILDMLNHG